MAPRWYIAYNLVMGLADRDGWVPVLLVRQERSVNYCEVFHGTQRAAAHNKILAWEAWTGEGLHNQGNQLRWKHT